MNYMRTSTGKVNQSNPFLSTAVNVITLMFCVNIHVLMWCFVASLE